MVLVVFGVCLGLLCVAAAGVSSLTTPAKGLLALGYLFMVISWVRRQVGDVPPCTRLHLLTDGAVLLRLDGPVVWRGRLEPRSWQCPWLVLLCARLPFGVRWLPIWRHRQVEGEYRRLLVGLRHDRWGLGNRQ